MKISIAYCSLKRVIICHVIGFLVVGLPKAFADTSNFKQKSGYISFSFYGQSIGGDFDGETYFINSDPYRVELYTVPDMAAGNGFAMAFGGRGVKWGYELIYIRTSHSAEWSGIALTAREQSVGFSPRVFLGHNKQTRPFLSGSIYYHWLRIKDGFLSGDIDYTNNPPEIISILVDDERYDGLGGTFAFGLEIYLNSAFSFRTEAGLRFAFYSMVKGPYGEFGDRIEKLSGNGLVISGGLICGFF